MKTIFLVLLVFTFFGCLVSCSTDNERKASNHRCDRQTLDLSSEGVKLIGINNDSALIYLKQAEELDSMCGNVNYHLSMVYSNLQDYKRAYHVNNRLLRQEADNPQYLMKAAIYAHFLNRDNDKKKYLGMASESYKKYDYKDFYQSDDKFPSSEKIDKMLYAFDVEVCNLLLGDKTAKDKINDLIDDDSYGIFDRASLYNLTPEKYYDFLQNQSN